MRSSRNAAIALLAFIWTLFVMFVLAVAVSALSGCTDAPIVTWAGMPSGRRTCSSWTDDEQSTCVVGGTIYRCIATLDGWGRLSSVDCARFALQEPEQLEVSP